jgi:hypothetical protein
MASTLFNALAPHVRDTMRMGVRWAGPRVAVAGVKFVGAAHAAREFVRAVAGENFEALTESEYLEATKGQQATRDPKAEEAPDLTDLDDKQVKGIVQSTGDGNGQDACMEPRTVILHCRNVRASRNLGQIEVIGGLIPQLSHWCVEVCGSSLNNMLFNLLLTINAGQRLVLRITCKQWRQLFGHRKKR